MPLPLHPADATSSPLPLSFGVDDGEYVFVSGMVAYDRRTGVVVGDPATAVSRSEAVRMQSQTTLDNVAAVLAGAGLTMADVLKVQVYLADIRRDFADFNVVYRSWFSGGSYPARTALGVTLAEEALLVEVDAIARRPR